MRILLVSSFLPYPLTSGGHVRLYNIIKQLSASHEVTLVCEKRSYQSQQDIEAVKKICKKVITVERRKQWSMGNILKTGFSSLPFLLVGHTNTEMHTHIASALATESYDLIHVETFYVYPNIPKTQIPVVLVEHNIEYLVYQRYITKMPLPIRLFLSIDVAKLKKYEEYYWKKATAVGVVSAIEKRYIPRSNVAVIHNGVDSKKFTVRKGNTTQEKRILYIGDFKWIQNTDAVSWILKDIWPKITMQQQSWKLWIVSRSIPDSIRNLTSDPNVIFEEGGSIPTETIFQQADVLLAPIRVGGGTSYKILEAMASGVPVVTTPLGIEGLDATKDKDVLVSDDPEEIAALVMTLLQDAAKAKKLLTNARHLVETQYTWEAIGKELETLYKQAVR